MTEERDVQVARMVAVIQQFIPAVNMLQSHLQSDVEAGKESGFAIPFAVNSAFLIELLLKTLTVSDGQSPSRTHDLARLFQELSDDRRAVVLKHHRDIAREHYDGEADPDALLIDLLGEAQDLFKDARYFFERQQSNDPKRYWFPDLAPIAEAMIRALREVEPKMRKPVSRITVKREGIP